jgi:ABC-2 type transport system ATP-binding protein
VSNNVIVVDEVWKKYRLFHERNQSLKGAFLAGFRSRHEEFWALQGVSFAVPAGSTFGLIGENGSGKSTLLKCVAKILRPEKGSVRTTGKMSALLELGAGFHPELSGRDNVYLNGSILGLSKREVDRLFDGIVSFAGLEKFIDTPVKNYSSGMYMRLGFSVAINVQPDLLLIDEILAVGDESFQRKCTEKFADLRRDGKTVVIVSHALGAVREMCSEVAYLEHGKLLAVGPADEVIDEYLGGVRHERRADGDLGSRYGEGVGLIDDVEMLDGDGSHFETISTGAPMSFRLHWSTTEPIDKPVFRVEVSTLSGTIVSSSGTKEHHQIPDSLDGSGHVDFHIPRLLLVPGPYDVTVYLTSYDSSRIYDVRRRVRRLEVQHGDPPDHLGLATFDGRWGEPTITRSHHRR